MNNGNRNYAAMTAFQDPSSKLFSLYEPPQNPMAGVTLVPVKDKEGKQMRVDAQFLKQYGVPERTGT